MKLNTKIGIAILVILTTWTVLILVSMTRERSARRIEEKPVIPFDLSVPNQPHREIPVKPEPTYSKEDLYWLSRVINAEATNQSDEGQIAVGNVVLNRVRIRHLSVKEVIFSRNQFSVVKSGAIYKEPSQHAVENAIKALSGVKVVPDSVYYFYNPKRVSRGGWITTRRVYKDIGAHRFAHIK